MARDGPRQRANKATIQKPHSNNEVPSEIEDTGRVISLLDVIRIVVTIIGAILASSYYITSGESFTYGYKPWFTSIQEWRQVFNGPIELTPQQLALYNGSDPNLPIYLVINGTIYDVSAGRHMYGPGGGYSVFAGRDATRAFVTGCFQEDRTHDLRDAELIYIPIEDFPDEDISSGERKSRAEREKRTAKKKVTAEVQKWADFYGKSKKYFEVGKVVGLEEPAGPAPPLCKQAQDGRPKRKKMSESKPKDSGKPVS